MVQDAAGLLIIKNFALVTFTVSTMLSIGMSVNLKQIKAIISNYKLMAKGLLANFLIVPIVAWILAHDLNILMLLTRRVKQFYLNLS